jgi:transglutaminase-like putative cysteine protease
MYYSIHHTTRFKYDRQISESIMEVRMQPRDDGSQRCLRFDLGVSPRAQVLNYRDRLGNIVHHFDVPRPHSQLAVTAQAVVQMSTAPAIPEKLATDAWNELDEIASHDDHMFDLMPSRFTEPTALLRLLARELNCESRHDDPLTQLRELNSSINSAFDYSPQTTTVDSPIDHALEARKGVCQDFAHIMLALTREYLRIPCRYVSGYLFHRVEDHDRSDPDATHAWIETFLPEIGWVGFDPTNNLIAGLRHIRVSVGRDYGDVPPTRGVFKGEAESELKVAVKVEPCDAPPPMEDLKLVLERIPPEPLEQHQQQQQQQ